MYPVQSITGSSARAIAASVEEAVATGSAASGTRLPPIRVIADHLDVANGTVARAVQLLRDRGIVETNGRRGTSIRRASVLAPRRTAMPVPEGAVDFSHGDPGLQPDPTSALAAAAGVASGYERPGRPALLPALMEHLAADADGDGIDAAHGLLTMGTMYGLELAIHAHLRPGDRIAVEDPGWADHLDLFTSMGMQLEPIPVDDAGMRPDRLAAVVDRVDAVVLTPRAQAPTGAAMDAVRRDQVAHVLAGRDLVVVEDDHAADIAGVDLHAIAAAPVTTHWVIARSLSKSWGPDLRIAAVFGDVDTVRRMQGRLRMGPGWVSRWLQAAALHLLESPEAQAQVAFARERLANRRGLLMRALDRHGIISHGRSGVNVWIPVPDEATVVAGLLARGWVVAPGARFRQRTGNGIRVTIGSISDVQATAFAADLADLLAEGPLLSA